MWPPAELFSLGALTPAIPFPVLLSVSHSALPRLSHGTAPTRSLPQRFLLPPQAPILPGTQLHSCRVSLPLSVVITTGVDTGLFCSLLYPCAWHSAYTRQVLVNISQRND